MEIDKTLADGFQYVRDELFDYQLTRDLISKALYERKPASTYINDGHIIDLLEEYGDDEGLSEGWWMEYGDTEDILINL